MVLELLHHGIVLETTTKVRVRAKKKGRKKYLDVKKSIGLNITALDARVFGRINFTFLNYFAFNFN